MSNEERDVPTLQDLDTEIGVLIQRLDDTPDERVSTQFLMNEIKNTILPLLRDTVKSVGYGFEDIQDMIDPVKIPRASADNIIELLEALKVASVGNTELHERIDDALADLEPEEEDDTETDEEET